MINKIYLYGFQSTQIRYLKNSGHRLSSKNDLKIIHNTIDNMLDLI